MMQRLSIRAFAVTVSLIMTVTAIHGAPQAAAQHGAGVIKFRKVAVKPL